MIGHRLWNTIFELAYWCFVSECGVCFVAFDVVCDGFDNGVWDVVWCSLCVSGYMLTVFWWFVLVETCCDGVVYVV